jgi:hypothetical protein
MSNSADNYLSALLEDIRDQNKVVIEAVESMASNLKLLATKDDLSSVASDLKIVKAAVTNISQVQNEQEHRITKLEAA